LNSPSRIIIAGGGAAGIFAAITVAELQPGAEVIVLEKGTDFLTKVRISGGGRCNVTHACFDSREFATRYPRGKQELIGPLHRFGAQDTVAWFANRGVELKAESDGRMFPVTNSSQTIIDCLLSGARNAGVHLVTRCGVKSATQRENNAGFTLTLTTGETMNCDCLLLAMGGCRTPAVGNLATSLGHTLEPPVPSLFTFKVPTPWLTELAGVSVPVVGVSAAGLRQHGALLVTHTGLSGPAILRLSAWGARLLHDCNYKFPLCIHWLPDRNEKQIADELQRRRKEQPARLVVNMPIAPLSVRLWKALVLAAGVERDTRWSELSRDGLHRLIQQLQRTELSVTGKNLNKEEFVTCGGVRLREVNFKTMESRICPSLYFAGELLDIDGLTGGFNFQAAWTTGWIAGQSIAKP